MPGSSFDGSPVPFSAEESELAAALDRHLHQLSREIGARSTLNPSGLEKALLYLEDELTSYGYEPLRIPFEVNGQTVANLEVELIGAAAPEEIISFAQVGYPALMITDTAVFRDSEYHQPGDLPERLDTERMARVVLGLTAVLAEFTGAVRLSESKK